MTKIEVTDDMIQIDAEILSRAFEVDPQELKAKMRDGTITSRAEQGEAEDAGKIRLTFFSQDRRVRITADDRVATTLFRMGNRTMNGLLTSLAGSLAMAIAGSAHAMPADDVDVAYRVVCHSGSPSYTLFPSSSRPCLPLGGRCPEGAEGENLAIARSLLTWPGSLPHPLRREPPPRGGQGECKAVWFN